MSYSGNLFSTKKSLKFRIKKFKVKFKVRLYVLLWFLVVYEWRAILVHIIIELGRADFALLVYPLGHRIFMSGNSRFSCVSINHFNLKFINVSRIPKIKINTKCSLETQRYWYFYKSMKILTLVALRTISICGGCQNHWFALRRQSKLFQHMLYTESIFPVR